MPSIAPKPVSVVNGSGTFLLAADTAIDRLRWYVWHARGEVSPTGSGDRQAPPYPFVEQHAADEQHAESKRLPYSGIIAELQS
jgi:hypothetical protein